MQSALWYLAIPGTTVTLIRAAASGSAEGSGLAVAAALARLGGLRAGPPFAPPGNLAPTGSEADFAGALPAPD
jgi:hypothetical protein